MALISMKSMSLAVANHPADYRNQSLVPLIQRPSDREGQRRRMASGNAIRFLIDPSRIPDVGSAQPLTFLAPIGGRSGRAAQGT